jgi:hypothetical protein
MLRPFVKQDAILGHVASRGDRLPRASSKDLWPHRVNRIGVARNFRSRIFQCRRSKLADAGLEWISISVIANSGVRRAGSRRTPAGKYVFWKTEEMVLPQQANDPSGLKLTSGGGASGQVSRVDAVRGTAVVVGFKFGFVGHYRHRGGQASGTVVGLNGCPGQWTATES